MDVEHQRLWSGSGILKDDGGYPQPRICAECKHCDSSKAISPTDDLAFTCSHPVQAQDRVTGRIVPVKCVLARAGVREAQCRPEGLLFEVK